MALLTTATASRDGVDLAGVAAAGGGDTFTNTGAEVIVVRNNSAGTRTITFATTATVDGLAVTDRVETVPAGGIQSFGPFKRAEYGSTVSVTYDSATTVNVAVLKVVPETV